MADLASSIITLAGLFRICLEAFDFVQTARTQKVDLRRLNLKLSIERCRLFAWGEALGLTQASRHKTRRLLDNSPFQPIIEETLKAIIELFTNSEALATRYGCHRYDPSLFDGDDEASLLAPETPTEVLSTAFDKFKLSSRMKGTTQKICSITRWVIKDRDKFGYLISEAKGLIDGLQDITKDIVPAANLELFINSRIRSISDEETLDMLSEVCESDHVSLSYAASCRLDDITSHSPREAETLDSTHEGGAWGISSMVMNGIEAMSVTELKRRLINYLQREQEEELERKVEDAAAKRVQALQEANEEHSMRREAELKAEAEQHDLQRRAEEALREAMEKDLRVKIETEIRDARKDPIRFKDAIGRNYNFPWERCCRWRDMEGLINQAFAHIDNLAEHVMKGRYDLIGPDKEIIMPNYWESMIEPGINITMMLWPIPEPSSEDDFEIVTHSDNNEAGDDIVSNDQDSGEKGEELVKWETPRKLQDYVRKTSQGYEALKSFSWLKFDHLSGSWTEWFGTPTLTPSSANINSAVLSTSESKGSE